MAPSSGHLLLAKGFKVVRYAVSKAAGLVRERLPKQSTTIETVPVRVQHQPRNPLASIRQAHSLRQQTRSISTLRSISSAVPQAANRLRTAPASQISRTALSRPFGAGFTTPLRPNLTLGAVQRSSLGGARNFSSSPTVHAQVVHNVSSAVRAFWCEGKRARYNGAGPRGEKSWKAVTETQHAALGKAFKAHEKGTWLEWRLNPTITALPLFQSSVSKTLDSAAATGVPEQTLSLNDPVLLNRLTSDFAKVLKTLAATLADLKRLSRLGDLPISLNPLDPSIIRVRFSGCDAEVVGRLCDELSITSALIREDKAWSTAKDTQMALLFPFAPSTGASDLGSDVGDFFEKRSKVDWVGMMSPPPQQRHVVTRPASTKSASSRESFLASPGEEVSLPSERNPWVDLEDESLGEDEPSVAFQPAPHRMDLNHREQDSVLGYDGLEGIYRFLAECDGARR